MPKAKTKRARKIGAGWVRARVRRLPNGRLHIHVLNPARKRKANPKRRRRSTRR